MHVRTRLIVRVSGPGRPLPATPLLVADQPDIGAGDPYKSFMAAKSAEAGLLKRVE